MKILSTDIILVSRLAQLKVREIMSSFKLKAYDRSRPTNAGSIFVSKIAKTIEAILIKKLRRVSLKANQL